MVRALFGLALGVYTCIYNRNTHHNARASFGVFVVRHVDVQTTDVDDVRGCAASVVHLRDVTAVNVQRSSITRLRG